MKNYKLTIQYDGTGYKGWQILKGEERTIQGKLTNILTRFCEQEVDIIGAGRTDAGVHARGQVANVHLNTDADINEIQEYINRYLPEDIAVIHIEEVGERFHARYNALEKTYSYCINSSPVQNVFNKRYEYHYGRKLDVDKMRQAAKLMLGTMDYTSFCGNSKFKKSAVRTVYSIDIEQNKDTIVIKYRGNGFLQNMVRIMTGTLIEVGNGTRQPEEITAIIEAKDRSLAGYTAPPQGLCLEEVKYDNN